MTAEPRSGDPPAAALACAPLDWQPVACPPQLAAGTVHLLWARLDLPAAEVERLAALLSPLERARAERRRCAVHRRRYAVSRGLLRTLVAHYAQTPVADVRFVIGPHGKPRLGERVAGRELMFNATDSGDCALYAFAWDHALGIDLECLPRRVAHDKLATRYFAAVEAAALQRFPDHARRQAFLACWTRKEAYGKAEGVGIHYPLDSVVLCAASDQPTFELPAAHSPTGTGWFFTQLQPPAPAVACLAIAAQDPHLRGYELTYKLTNA